MENDFIYMYVDVIFFNFHCNTANNFSVITEKFKYIIMYMQRLLEHQKLMCQKKTLLHIQ